MFGVKQTKLQRFLIGFLILERGLTPPMWFAMLNNNVFFNMQVLEVRFNFLLGKVFISMTSSEEKYVFYDCHVEYLTRQNVSSSHCGHIVCLLTRFLRSCKS